LFFFARSSFGGGFGRSKSGFNPFSNANSTSTAPKREKNSAVKISFDQAVNGVTISVLGKKVKVPAGVNDGQTIRAIINGTIVNIKVSIKPNELYELDGKNIILNFPVTIAEVALGGTFEVPLYSGGKKKIKIPAGTQNGQLFRIKNEGVPLKNGDLLVRVNIIVPKNINRKQKDALKTFMENEKENPRPW
jgi:molecular chaperone DnaJ